MSNKLKRETTTTSNQVRDSSGNLLGVKTVTRIGGVKSPSSNDVIPTVVPNDGRFDSDKSREDITGNLKDNSQAYIDNQNAMLEQAHQNQVTNLEKSYAGAVQNGEMSVREAQQAFEEQKEALYGSAYQQSEETKTYGTEMGLGHSQQMIGLQQSDDSRFNKLHSQNTVEKDRRITDIRDRLKLIQQQKELDLTNARHQFDLGLAGAQAQGDMMYNEGLIDFKGKDHFAQLGQQFDIDKMDKQQGFTEDNMATEHGYTQENMDKSQGFTEDNMATEQEYTQENMDKQQGFTEKNMTAQQKNDLEKMKVEFGYNIQALEKQSALRIKEFGVQHDYDVKKMAIQLENDIKMEAEKYGYQSKLMSQDHKNAIARASASTSSKMSQANTSYKRKVAAAKTPAAKKAVTTKHERDMTAMYSQVVQQTTSDMLFAKAPNKDPKSAEYKKWADQQRSLNAARKRALAKLKK